MTKRFRSSLFLAVLAILSIVLGSDRSVVGSEKPNSQQSSHGNNSPNIIGNNNKVTINVNSPAKLPQPTFHEDSDSVTLVFGATAMTSSLAHLRGNPMRPLDISGFEPVAVGIGDENKIGYYVALWGGEGNPPLEIHNDHFTVRVPTWDRNFSPTAFEVIDENGRPVFQMMRKGETTLIMYGIFAALHNFVALVGPKQTKIEIKNFTLAPIFKYPSWKYPGVYAN
jgi:hypothetical protein